MSAPRNLQLDGWRAFAVLGVMWLHWAPAAWRGPLPFEIGLFFFLTLTGFLITRVLLRERAKGEAAIATSPEGTAWRWPAYLRFQRRRALRILVPCYAAMLFAFIFGAPDLRQHPLLYLTQVVNFHIALMPGWPDGTAHYWTLAIQQQFYLVWPLLIFFLPRRALLPALIICVALAPLSRWVIEHSFPQVHHVGAISTCALDYFGVGALLAWAMERGLAPGDRRLNLIAWLAAIPYTSLYVTNQMGISTAGFGYFQQTLVSVMFAGLISATLAGFRGPLGQLLVHPAVQHIAKLSYGLYLFHTAVPLLVGKVIPWLWLSPALEPLIGLRLLAYALFSWGVAWLCWRYIEQPMDRIKAKVPA